MWRIVARRLVVGTLVVFAVWTLTFVLVNVIGDQCVASLGARAHRSQIEACRRRCGLDRPVLERYATRVSQLARGDLGRSCPGGRDVGEVIATRLPRTLLLGGMAMLFELLIGVGIGVLAAVRRNTWFDTGVMGASFLGISAPTFVTGVLFLFYFAFRLGWFPVGGWGVDPLDHVWHAVLPAFTLAIIGAATYARLVRSEMIDTLRTDYVRTARAKGVSAARAVVVHALRNALLPIVTLMGLNLTILVSGAVITESIYAWPGMGRLAIEAIYSLEAEIVMGVVLLACVTVQVGNLLGDLAVAALDPRVRAEGK